MRNPFIPAIGQVFPLIAAVVSAGPAAKVKAVRLVCRFDIRNDAAGVADAFHIAQLLPSGAALHHAGVGITGMEDGIVGVHEGYDFLLQFGKEGGLFIAALRNYKGKDKAHEKSRQECGDFRMGKGVSLQPGRQGNHEGPGEGQSKGRRIDAEVESQKQNGEGKKGR